VKAPESKFPEKSQICSQRHIPKYPVVSLQKPLTNRGGTTFDKKFQFNRKECKINKKFTSISFTNK
jgi:hypothetical protein